MELRVISDIVLGNNLHSWWREDFGLDVTILES
jgi:hypothetical protein